jgi:hypothetical protein
MRLLVLSCSLFFLACGKATDGAKTDGVDTDTGVSATGELPPQPAHAGVAYIVHYNSNQLIWTRTDKDRAVGGGSLELAGVSHSMALDAVNDRVAIVHDSERKVALYNLDRPKNDATAVEDPQWFASVSTNDVPLFTKIDPYHQRLYVHTVNVDSGKSMMHIYSIDGDVIETISSFSIPTSAAWDIDTVRQLLFIYDTTTVGVHVYDLYDDLPQEMTGSPIPFGAWYPEENTWAFSVRNLRADPWSARVYAGRPQGTLSELMAFSYDQSIPGENNAYSDWADLTQVRKIEDGFDVSIPFEERTNLLEAHTALPDRENGLVFLAGRAWNGTASSDVILPLDEDLQLLTGCADDDDGFCWLQSYSDGSPNGYLSSEGAACIDTENQVILTTTVDFFDDEGKGQLALFSYQDNGKMTPLLKSDGSNPTASVYPVDAVCH